MNDDFKTAHHDTKNATREAERAMSELIGENRWPENHRRAIARRKLRVAIAFLERALEALEEADE